MKPGPYPITLEAGVGYSRRMTWSSGGIVVPLAGWSGRFEIRHPDNQGEYLLTLPAGVAGLVLADVAPNIAIDITEAQVLALETDGLLRSMYRLVLDPPDAPSFVLLKDEIVLESF